MERLKGSYPGRFLFQEAVMNHFSSRTRAPSMHVLHLPFLFLFLFCLFTAQLCQADDLLDDSQVWSSITATGTLKPAGDKWRYWLEGVGRFGNDVSTLSQGIVRPALGYALNEHASVWLGYAHIFTDTPFVKTSFDEDRSWQQFLWTQPLGAGTFTTRARLEQRFSDTGSDTASRYRHFFKLTWPIKGLSNVSAVTYDEVFVNLDDVDWGPQAGLDQNRAFVGMGYAFSKTVKTELGYLNQFIDRPGTPNRMTHGLAINLLLIFP